jgi:hypothetical protein
VFYFSLCEKLGYATPRQLLGAMTARDVTEWAAYYVVKAEQAEERARADKARMEAERMAHKMSRGG